MRALAFTVLVACSGDPGQMPIDAAIDAAPDAVVDPCAASYTPAPRDGCTTDGMRDVVFDGTTPWTLTGTRTQFSGSPMAYSATYYLLRTGTGHCAFALSSMPISTPFIDPATVVDDTSASSSYSRSYPHPAHGNWSLCARVSDGAIAFHAYDYQSMPPADATIDGVLTR